MEKLFELRRRTFDTPHFRGITFIEAEAKSILNHVPSDRFGFNWTINPYRGCSHACSYCLSGDTPILMADGRPKPLADVRVGDRIYGTERWGSHRRYVTTTVLAHWSTTKPAYRLTLEDSTELIAGGDHRFLSERGWKFVAGVERGRFRRPHLTVNDRLMGTGRFAAGPEKGEDYQRGYLCGSIRGEEHLVSYAYESSGRASAAVHRTNLALVDLEPLRRARADLAGESSIPRNPSDEWCKGFLAGVFDAEGSYSGGMLRIASTERAIAEQTTACLSRLGFPSTTDSTARPNPVIYVRVLGGLQEQLRFFHTVDPAITRKGSIAGRAVESRSALRVTSVEPLGLELPLFDITTGTGDFIASGVVSHNCFARTTHTYLDMNAGRDFESKIVVKVNAPELLRKELRAKRWKGEHIAMGTATDPYQRAEGRYRIMPRIISTLTEYRNPFSILTKGTLILRDLELLADAAAVMPVSTAFSIGTLDEEVWRRSEPGTPHPRKRMDAVRKLNEAGVECGVMLAPILPGISDDEGKLKEVIAAAFDAGATHVSPILLHLRPGVKEVYMAWLEDNYPDLVPRYMSMYARRAYAPTGDKNAIRDRVDAIKRSLPQPRARGRRPWRSEPRDEPAARSEQLSLI